MYQHIVNVLNSFFIYLSYRAERGTLSSSILSLSSTQGKEMAVQIVKLQDGSVVFEDTSTDLIRGQVIKGVERSLRDNPKEPLPGRIKYRDTNDHSEVSPGYVIIQIVYLMWYCSLIQVTLCLNNPELRIIV